MSVIIINNNEIFYERNENFDSSKDTILFIHGAGQSSLTWEYQLETFSKNENLNFIIPDLPGHGNSKGSGLTSIEHYADFTQKFIASLDLNSVIIVGHSMGGAIAQLIALENPEYLKAIVLVCTGAWMRVSKESMISINNNYAYFCNMAPTRAFSEHSDEGLKVKFSERLLSTPKNFVYQDLKACDEFDISDRIINIKIPTLIIGAELDLMTPPKYSEYLHHQIHDSELVIVNDSGHFVMQEKPDEFKCVILKFIDNL